MKKGILIFLVAVFCISCHNPVKLERKTFEKIDLGMTTDEVKRMLGEPQSIRMAADSTVIYSYLTEKSVLTEKYASINFTRANRASSFYYSNPE